MTFDNLVGRIRTQDPGHPRPSLHRHPFLLSVLVVIATLALVGCGGGSGSGGEGPVVTETAGLPVAFIQTAPDSAPSQVFMNPVPPPPTRGPSATNSGTPGVQVFQTI